MPRKFARQNFLTWKKHLLRAQWKNHTDLRHLHMVLCISLITARNFPYFVYWVYSHVIQRAGCTEELCISFQYLCCKWYVSVGENVGWTIVQWVYSYCVTKYWNSMNELNDNGIGFRKLCVTGMVNKFLFVSYGWLCGKCNGLCGCPFAVLIHWWSGWVWLEFARNPWNRPLFVPGLETDWTILWCKYSGIFFLVF